MAVNRAVLIDLYLKQGGVLVITCTKVIRSSGARREIIEDAVACSNPLDQSSCAILDASYNFTCQNGIRCFYKDFVRKLSRLSNLYPFKESVSM